MKNYPYMDGWLEPSPCSSVPPCPGSSFVVPLLKCRPPASLQQSMEIAEGREAAWEAPGSSSTLSSLTVTLLFLCKAWYLRDISAPEPSLVSTENMNEIKIAVLGSEGVGKSGRRAVD